MNGTCWSVGVHILAVSGLLSCAPTPAPSRGAKRAEFSAQFCALAKPCTAGAASSAACESAVAASLPPSFDEPAGELSLKALRAAQASSPSCNEALGLVAVAKSVPLELPKSAPGTVDVPSVLNIVLAADGTTQVGAEAVPDDEAVLGAARAAHAKNSEVRAVIKADSAVSHGRVIHVLDLLKQAQIMKIAFGVSPLPPP